MTPITPIAPDPDTPPTSKVTDEQAQETLRVLDKTELGKTHVTRDSTALLEGDYPLGMLSPGVVICGNCQVERSLQPHESQRPGLYLCRAPEGEVIVKVYATDFPPRLELWRRLSCLHHKHIIHTIRTVEEGGIYYEIQEYCPGGSLAARVPKPGSGIPPISPEWITKVLIPQIYEGLNYLHQQEIIHRDIKPANIYIKSLKPEILVLADFDISAVLEQTHTSRDTMRAAGTWMYTAPEAFPRFVDDHASGKLGRITRSSDYYSLGITIIELLLGTTSLHQCELPDLFDFYLQGQRVEIPKGIPGNLSLLLRGLLIRNRHTRWTGEQVVRWLANDLTDEDLQAIHDDEYYELARASRPYRIGNHYAVDLPSLAEAMNQEREVATEDLITGDILLNWIGNLDPNTAREIRRERDKHYLTPEVVLNNAVMWCDPTRPFIFSDGSEAATVNDWITHAIRLARTIKGGVEALCSSSLLLQLAIWLRAKVKPEPKLADGVEKIINTPPRNRLEELAYLFQPNRPFVIMRGVAARNPRELVSQTYGHPEDWRQRRPLCYEASFQRWYDGALYTWMRQRGLASLAEQAEGISKQLEEEPFAAFETILRLLDPELPKIPLILDNNELSLGCRIPYGKQRKYILRYQARGPGVPFGALKPQGRCPGILIENHILQQRDGVVEITIDTKIGDLPAFRPYQASLILDSGIAQLCNAPVKFTYRAIFPFHIAISRLLVGAFTGALFLGIPRLVLMMMMPEKDAGLPITWNQIKFDTLWNDIQFSRFPNFTQMVCLLFLAFCVYGGLWLWVRTIKDSEA